MQLTDAQVADFNRAYAVAFGTELPPDEAQTMLGNLVELYTRLIALAQTHSTKPSDQLDRQAQSAAPSTNTGGALN